MTTAEQKIQEFREKFDKRIYEGISAVQMVNEMTDWLEGSFKEIELEKEKAIEEKLAMFPYCTFGCKSCEELKGQNDKE